jgi:hypothetical protein
MSERQMINGRWTYDSRPTREAMETRLKHDKPSKELSDVVEIIMPQRHYAIRCYAVVTTTQVYVATPQEEVASNNVPQISLHTVPAYRWYHLRRDGKITDGGGVPITFDKVVLMDTDPFKLRQPAEIVPVVEVVPLEIELPSDYCPLVDELGALNEQIGKMLLQQRGLVNALKLICKENNVDAINGKTFTVKLLNGEVTLDRIIV